MTYIETGEVISVHGLRGEVKVYPWADSPDFLEEFDTFYIQKNKMHYRRYVAENVRADKNVVIIKFQGIDNVETARNLVGKVLYLDKDEIELPEGYHFVVDLIGCKIVNDDTNKEIGTVKDVKNLGASDIYYIDGNDGKEYLFPAVDEFIVSTDTDNKIIRVKVIEGMFSEN